MKNLIMLFVFGLTATSVAAAEAPLLEMNTVSPYLKCIVTANNVTTEKRVGTVLYSKSTAVSIHPQLLALIETVSNQNQSVDDTPYFAYRQSSNGVSKRFSFSNTSSESGNLVRFITGICKE